MPITLLNAGMVVNFPYTGPGDVVANAVVWFGVRAYSAAKVGTRAIRLRRDSDNAERDFFTIPGGDLDLGAITAWSAGNLFVRTWYDQTGNGRDVSQATAANQPGFALGAVGGYPALTFVHATQQQLVSAVYPIPPDPKTWSQVFNYTNIGAQGALITESSGAQYGFNLPSADNSYMYEGASLPQQACLAGTWHATQARYDQTGASSSAYIDGTNIANDLGAPATPGTNTIVVGGNFATPGTSNVTCYCTELGQWGFAFTTTGGGQADLMNKNQHNYYRF